MMELSEFKLISGVGNYHEKKACIMSAAVAKWRMQRGEPLGAATDELACVCPVIRAYAIRLNDACIWDSDDERTAALMPRVDALLETRGSNALMQRRAFLCADYAVRKFAPIALRGAALDDEIDYDDFGCCLRCDGEGFITICCDDICRGQGFCMHGDGDVVCPDCNGEVE